MDISVMEMEIVFLQKKLPNLQLLKFVVLDILQIQMGNVFTQNRQLHQLHILVQLDLLLMETEVVFKKE